EDSSSTEFTLVLVSVVFVGAGVVLAWAMYSRRPVRAETIGVPRNAIHALVLNKYYVDELYDAVFVRPVYAAARWCARVFDAEVIDGIVNGVGAVVVGWARGLRRVPLGFAMTSGRGLRTGP